MRVAVLLGAFLVTAIHSREKIDTIATVRSLMGSQRPVPMKLRFQGIATIDTDQSIEDRFRFQSVSGLEFYVKLEWNHALGLQQVQSNSQYAPFLAGHMYDLDLRFTGQTARGLILVDATPAEVWELRLTRAIPPYTGDITEQDLRIRQLVDSLRSGTAPPSEIKLFFSRRERIHLVFYDLEGNEVRFQYRRDRWETKELEKVRFLIPGAAYLVKGKFKGLILDEKTIPASDAEFANVLERPIEEFFLLFDFESATPLRTEQILF